MNYFVIFRVPGEFWKKILQEKSLQGSLLVASSFLIPAVMCSFVYYFDLIYQKDSYGFLVAVYSIFAAFLFASQISAFTIFQGIQNARAIELKSKLAEAQSDRVSKSVTLEEDRRGNESIRKGFSLINCAISYSVLLSITILIVLIVLFLTSWTGNAVTLVLTFLMSHFFLVLIFAIGQSHEVFSLGYDAN